MTAGRVVSRCSVKSPKGPSILTSVSGVAASKSRLKAVFLIRVATRGVCSSGVLAREKPRTLPSASVSMGLNNVMSTNWPALKVQSGGRSNRNAMVWSATLQFPTRCELKVGQVKTGAVLTAITFQVPFKEQGCGGVGNRTAAFSRSQSRLLQAAWMFNAILVSRYCLSATALL